MRPALLGAVLLAGLAGNLSAECCQFEGQYDGGNGANGYYSHGYGCPGHYNGYDSDSTSRYRYSVGTIPYVAGSGPGYTFGTSLPRGYFGNTTGSWSTSSDSGLSGSYSSGGWGFNYSSGGTGFSYGSR